MLALEVEYLTGRATASERHQRESAEWPPHPGRLFSALVAAYAECDLGASVRAALEWLERQSPPSLTVAEADQRSVVPIFVPVNDNAVPDKIPAKGFTASQIAEGIKVLPERRSRQQRAIPSVSLRSPLVHFHWPTVNSHEFAAHRPAFERLAAHVTYLGHSSSLVRVAVCDFPPEPTLVPADDGDVMLRVPTPGRLSELIDAYENRQARPSAGLYCSYQSRVVASPSQACRTVFGEMIVFRRIDGPRLPLPATVRLTTMVRKALQSLAAQPPREVLSGHTPDGSPSQHPHVAVVPLAFVNHAHADGDIKGFAVVLPFALDPYSEDRRHIAHTLVKLKEIVMGSCGKWSVQRVTPAIAATPLPAGESLRIEGYTKPATRWSTVTPMVLDGFPKQRPSKGTADLIRRACTRIGLPEPAYVEFGNASWLRGASASRQFAYRYKEGLPGWPLVHAFLEFSEPVCGPILLGAGRYIGLGLCRRCPDTGKEERDDH